MTDDFSLFDYQVPNPPVKSNSWPAALRWMVCVMDAADTRLGFIAGCLSYYLKNDGLTQAQAHACNKIYARVVDDHKAGILVCQNSAERRVAGCPSTKGMN